MWLAVAADSVYRGVEVVGVNTTPSLPPFGEVIALTLVGAAVGITIALRVVEWHTGKR